MKRYAMVLAVVLGLAIVVPARADIVGCVDSPENPTAVLALAGTAGALTVALRSRIRRRR